MTSIQEQAVISLASEIDGICVLMDDIDQLFQLLIDEMEQGNVEGKENSDARLIWFLRRLPVRRALLHTIYREFQNRREQLDSVGQGLYDLCEKR